MIVTSKAIMTIHQSFIHQNQGWLKNQNIGYWEGGGKKEREDVSTTKSISGGIHNHENLINEV